ncbi:hypothetical protein HBI25_061600 [Parastagonospora nodorum]|nr:hypothetical protein HBH52_071680 [Parastagonospora nodorum]KAH4023819.1 hypothetical protein HBI09_164460 [Parastagonospora nodorum]KAH4278697.1 hypothetical protein HBI04_084190 [Parastagonospora nodorum]KAH4848249.1 hypothetical protein HBH75_153080 [Parastagonospora nodorum]KAH4985252.1 hypothetical protein HBI76_132170 [Parastagonospora nodorum]
MELETQRLAGTGGRQRTLPLGQHPARLDRLRPRSPSTTISVGIASWTKRLVQVDNALSRIYKVNLYEMQVPGCRTQLHRLKPLPHNPPPRLWNTPKQVPGSYIQTNHRALYICSSPPWAASRANPTALILELRQRRWLTFLLQLLLMEVCITMVVVTTVIILMLVMVEAEEVTVEEAVEVDLILLGLYIGNDSSRVCYVRDIAHFRVRYSTDPAPN